jgi:hypothetical protein
MKKKQSRKAPSSEYFIESEDSRWAYRLARNKNGALSVSKLEYAETPDWLKEYVFESMGDEWIYLDRDLNASGWNPVTSAQMHGLNLTLLNSSLNSRVKRVKKAK